VGVTFVVGAVTLAAGISGARAQEEPAVEIITAPPAQPEASAEEPSGEPEAPAAESPPKVEPPKEKLGQLRVGGGIGFGFGTNVLSFGIAPQVSYLFKKIVEPGVSIRYEYTKDQRVIPDAVWNTFGSSLFVRLYPIPSIFFLVEGELINTGFKQGDFSSGRANYGNLLLGGGYIMGVGRGAFVAMSLKVNVFRNPFYPSNIPIIGFGAGFGF
jgi:hypothetical protein